MVVFCHDISNWQGDVDMSSWLSMNIHGCFAKALEGMTGIDRKWSVNKKKLGAMAGPDFVPGAYHYMNNIHPGGDQCRAFLDLVPGDWMHGFDVEAPGPLDVDGWFKEYRKHYPNKVVALYTNEPMWVNRSKVPKMDVPKRYGPVEIWIAGAYRGAYQAGTDDFRKIWSRVPTGADGGLPQLGFETYAIMQYSGSAKVPGVSGDCDAGVAGSIDVLKRLASRNGASDDMSQADIDAINSHLDSKIDDIAALAAKQVWTALITSDWDGKPASAAALLASTNRYSIEAAYSGKRPAGNGAPGTLTYAGQLFANVLAAVSNTDSVEAALATLAAAEKDNATVDQVAQLLNEKLGNGPGGQLSKQDVLDAIRQVVLTTRYVPQTSEE
jgi:GH25 family lysozyme M1 (1,4-beta-N-acetylmuramidase)